MRSISHGQTTQPPESIAQRQFSRTSLPWLAAKLGDLPRISVCQQLRERCNKVFECVRIGWPVGLMIGEVLEQSPIFVLWCAIHLIMFSMCIIYRSLSYVF